MPGHVPAQFSCPYTAWDKDPSGNRYDFPDWIQMLLNSIWATKESIDVLGKSGITLDMGKFGDIATIMGNPKDPDSYNADPSRPLRWADIIHEIRASRGIYRDKDAQISTYSRRHRMDPSLPLADQYEQGPEFDVLDPTTWSYLFYGNEHPAFSPYHPAYASLERAQGYQKGFWGNSNPQAPMSMGELDEAGWKELFDDYKNAKELFGEFINLQDILKFAFTISLPDLAWLNDVARQGGSILQAVYKMQVREESFIADNRKRGYFQILIAQNEQLIEELRKLQGLPSYERDLDPGTMTQEGSMMMGLLKNLGLWDDLPSWYRTSYPYTGDELNPNYGDFVAQEGTPSDALQTWTDADGNVHKTTKSALYAKWREGLFDEFRSNLPALRGKRPRQHGHDLDYVDRTTLQDILDALAGAPRHKNPSNPVQNGGALIVDPRSDGVSVPDYDIDQVYDIATREDQVREIREWWDTLMQTTATAIDAGDVLENTAMGGADIATDIGAIAALGGNALMEFMNHLLLQMIVKHLAGGNWWNPVPGDSVMEALRGKITPLIDEENTAGNERNLLDDTKALYNFFHGVED